MPQSDILAELLLLHRKPTNPHNNSHKTCIPSFQFMEAHYLLTTCADLPSFVRFLIRAHCVSKQFFELVHSLERVDSNFSSKML